MAQVEHNFIAGTSIDYDKSLFFDLMTSGNAYLGFSRNEPIWGFCSLLKIRHRTTFDDSSSRTWPTDIMGQANGGSPETDASKKFYDLNSEDILLPGEIPSAAKNVYMSYILKSADATVKTNHTFLNSDGIGILTVDYMNDEWMRIRGLSSDYLDYMISQYPVDEYDYYIFNYYQEVDSRTAIEVVDEVVRSTIEYPVRLMYSTETNAGYPTTAFGNNLIGNLTRSINIFGETEIIGLRGDFVTDGSGYIDNNSLENAIFFITNADGIVIQDNMRYVSTYETGDEISLIFSYPLVGEASQNSGRIKVRNTVNPNTLVAFHERYTTGADINDGNPPPLTLNYLKTGMIHSSIMDVLGIKQITSSDVRFSRRIDNQSTEDYLVAAGMSLTDYPTGNLEKIIINDDEETEVRFFVTDDVNFARQYYFDLVRINLELNSTTPISSVYRQLFICYKPYEENGTDLCSENASPDVFTHDDLFDESQHKYHLGVLLYLANKKPVWRSYIDGTEDFVILI